MTNFLPTIRLPCYILLPVCLILTSCQDQEENSTAGEWKVPVEAAQQSNPVRYDVDSVSAGRILFEQHCQQCHGYYGEGNGIVGAVLNQQPANLLHLAGKEAEGAFAWKIREGRDDMPSFGNTLSDMEIWQIVNFVASLENEEGSLGSALQVP